MIDTAPNETLVVDFDWKIDASYENYITFYVNNRRKARIQAIGDWVSQREFIESAGQHTLEWCYEKFGEGANYADKGWLDQLRFSRINRNNSQADDLREALDNHDSAIQFRLSGVSQWFSQNASSNDDSDALQSGKIEAGGDTIGLDSCLHADVSSASSDRYIEFYWKADTSPYYGNLSFYINNTRIKTIDGRSSWERERRLLTRDRDHALRWCYRKPINVGYPFGDQRDEGRGWLDQLRLADAM